MPKCWKSKCIEYLLGVPAEVSCKQTALMAQDNPVEKQCSLCEEYPTIDPSEE